MILFLCRLLRLLGILRSFQGIYLEGDIRLLLRLFSFTSNKACVGGCCVLKLCKAYVPLPADVLWGLF